MGEWAGALMFGLVLIAFVLGLSSVIMGFMQSEEGGEIRHRIEYGFLGATGIVLSLVLSYTLF